MATWTLRPNSALPAALRANLNFGGMSDPSVSLIDAWVTSVVDTNRGRVILARTGGHADGAHNGVRAFDLAGGAWSMLRSDSTAYVLIGSSTTAGLPASAWQTRYADGSPASVHSYDGTCYMPPPFDEVWSAHGIYWSPGGESSGSATFGFKLATNTWRDLAPRGGGYSCQSVWDPVTQRVIFSITGGVYAYIPSLTGPGTYTTLITGTNPGGTTMSTLALDEVGRKIYCIAQHTVAPFRIHMLDLNNLAAKWQAIATSGDTSIGAIPGVGLIWDAGRLVAYGKNATNNGGAVYIMDPAVGVWARQTNTGTAPLPSTQGTWKKFFKWQTTFNILWAGPTGGASTGITQIVPDGGTLPATVPIKVATDFTITSAPSEPPPIPPDPPGGTSPIPVNTWTMVPTLPVGTPATIRTGKHQRVVWDNNRNRHLIFGGDNFGTDNGQPAVYTMDSLTGALTLLSPTCVPAPDLMPNYPDNVVVALDSRRDRVIMLPGFYFKQNQHSNPVATITPAATTGNNVVVTASAAIFASWHATVTPFSNTPRNGPGFDLEVVDVPNGSTVVSRARIVAYDSPTQVRVNITTAFAATTAIASNLWHIANGLRGYAAIACGRNIYAGDTGVIDGDIVYNLATNKWEQPTWPLSPYGYGSDGGGPSWGVYDETSDAIYSIRNNSSLYILHLGTTPNTWESVSPGAGMVAGEAKTRCVSHNSYRAQFALANGTVYFMSSRGGVNNGLISYHIATRTWNSFAAPVGYVTTPDDTEQMLVYDPVSNVLLHPNSTSLTGPVTNLYIFKIATSTWETRAIPVISPERVNLGSCVWDPKTLSMLMHGRNAIGVPGNACYHYRYAP